MFLSEQLSCVDTEIFIQDERKGRNVLIISKSVGVLFMHFVVNYLYSSLGEKENVENKVDLFSP